MKNIATALIALIATATPLAAQTAPEDRRSPVAVNYDVNSRIEYTSDGKVDNWQMPTKKGDCEDMALLKRKMLIEGGWDERDIELIMVVRTRDLKKDVIDYSHIVVYIRSIDMVLDILPQSNGSNSIMQTEYSFKSYLETWKYTAICKVRDMSQGIKPTASERCGAWYAFKR